MTLISGMKLAPIVSQLALIVCSILELEIELEIELAPISANWMWISGTLISVQLALISAN